MEYCKRYSFNKNKDYNLNEVKCLYSSYLETKQIILFRYFVIKAINGMVAHAS